MYQIIKDKNINIIKIPFVDIANVDIVMAKGRETMQTVFNRLTVKPDIMCNGGLFNMSDGSTITTTYDEGVKIRDGVLSDFGMISGTTGIWFDYISKFKGVKDAIGGSPSLVIGNKVSVDCAKLGDIFLNRLHTRKAIGNTSDSFVIVDVDMPGITIPDLANYMLKLGCISAINLDGGGSTRTMLNNKGTLKSVNTPTEDRAVDNFVCVYIKSEVKQMKTIYIDAGHGGTETGAISITNVPEKDINLPIALKVKELLVYNGFNVVMTRETDKYVTIADRCTMANNAKADLFISIHHNANDKKRTGGMAIHSIHFGVGADVAKCLDAEFEAMGQGSVVWTRESEITKGQDYYGVIRGTAMPAVIGEFCYIDDADFYKIDTKEEQDKEAYAYAKAICKYYGVTFKDNAIPPHWAQAHYDSLNTYGMGITETRFDDKITRGECFALLNGIYKLLKK